MAAMQMVEAGAKLEEHFPELFGERSPELSAKEMEMIDNAIEMARTESSSSSSSMIVEAEEKNLGGGKKAVDVNGSGIKEKEKGKAKLLREYLEDDTIDKEVESVMEGIKEGQQKRKSNDQKKKLNDQKKKLNDQQRKSHYPNISPLAASTASTASTKAPSKAAESPSTASSDSDSESSKIPVTQIIHHNIKRR
jgi:hypothetical protein